MGAAATPSTELGAAVALTFTPVEIDLLSSLGASWHRAFRLRRGRLTATAQEKAIEIEPTSDVKGSFTRDRTAPYGAIDLRSMIGQAKPVIFGEETREAIKSLNPTPTPLTALFDCNQTTPDRFRRASLTPLRDAKGRLMEPGYDEYLLGRAAGARPEIRSDVDARRWKRDAGRVLDELERARVTRGDDEVVAS